MNKSVKFCLDSNTYHETYNCKEYTRLGDMSTLRSRNVTDEWQAISRDLNRYKMTEMIVHINSINNTQLR